MSIPQYPRAILSSLRQDLEIYPVVALMGARQVGKSTLAHLLAKERGMAYCTLDDRDILAQSKEDPEGLLATLGESGVIDEAQRAPTLFLALKAVVDRAQRPGQYLLCGSNQPAMSGAVGDSLLGRAAYRTLRPLTLSELRLDEIHAGWDFLFAERVDDVLHELERRAAAKGELDWRTVVGTGGFPRAVALPPPQRRRLLNDYIEVFAHRDIREQLNIDSGARFEQFLRLLASRTAQLLNANGLAGDLGIPVTTIRRWLSALQRSYLIERVSAWSRNAGHRVTKSPKLFMTDVALAMAAAQETEATGFHLETLVASDLAVWRDGSPIRQVHHWRTQSGQEVDFILERERRLLPVEIKSTTAVGRSECRHLRVFLDKYDAGARGLLLSADPQIRQISEGIVAAPWWAVV